VDSVVDRVTLNVFYFRIFGFPCQFRTTAAPHSLVGSVLEADTGVLSGQAVLKGVLSGELNPPSVMFCFCNNYN
jgi:hypothetical protein